MSYISTYDICMTKKAESQTMRLKWLFLTFICSCHRFMTLISKSQRFIMIDFMSWVLASCHINKCHVGINVDVALRWQIHTQNPILTAIQPTRPQTHQITNHALDHINKHTNN